MRVVKGKTRRKNRGIKILIALLIVAMAVTTAAYIAYKAFVLETVDVVGNEIYSDEQIENWVLSEDDSWNTLYVLLRNRFQEQEKIPFMDSMEVSMVSPTEIEVTVSEKGILGYVYIPELDENAYFDQDGFVVELSNRTIAGVTKITGLDVESAQLYEELDFGNSTILSTLLSLTQLLAKYDIEPQNIYVQDGRYFLSYGSIQVDLGYSSHMSDKVQRLSQIMPELTGHTGTLHMNTWTETSTDVYFTPGELTQIPAENEASAAQEESDETEPEENEDQVL